MNVKDQKAEMMAHTVEPCGPERRYFESLDRGVLEIQRCTACAKHVFFPRIACPHCGSTHLDWIRASGKGTVYSRTTVRRKPESGGDYNISLVDLAEGVRMMSRVETIDPNDVAIGMSVQAKIVSRADKALVVFTPCKE